MAAEGTMHEADPRLSDRAIRGSAAVVTEMIGNGLNGNAELMRIALRRTAFSPIIYEMIDFANGIHEDQNRMLAQTRALPKFLVTPSDRLEAAVTAVGGRGSPHPPTLGIRGGGTG